MIFHRKIVYIDFMGDVNDRIGFRAFCIDHKGQ